MFINAISVLIIIVYTHGITCLRYDHVQEKFITKFILVAYFHKVILNALHVRRASHTSSAGWFQSVCPDIPPYYRGSYFLEVSYYFLF